MKEFSKFYYTSLSTLLDQICSLDLEPLHGEFNQLVIKLIHIIRVTNESNSDEEEKYGSKESSGEDSESNNENINSMGRAKQDSKTKYEDLKIKLTLLVQLLNKVVIHACSMFEIEKIKEALGYYIGTIFSIEESQPIEPRSEMLNLTYITLRGLNSQFVQTEKDSNPLTSRCCTLSKYLLQDCLLYIFTNLQNLFQHPKSVEYKDQQKVGAISEAIKLLSSIYVHSDHEQKQILIDPIVQLVLGALVSIKEKGIQTPLVGALGEVLYGVCVAGDPALVRNLSKL